MKWSVIQGDVLSVLDNFEDNYFHGVLTDPPYGISFLRKKWDYDIPKKEIWQEILRVCKPGANLLSFGGPRTFHRLVCEIEDAGWEVRDMLMWAYFNGFPKGLDIGIKNPGYAGYNTSLKPAYEPIILCNKQIEKTYGHNAEKHGVAGINIDGCRISSDEPWRVRTGEANDSIGTFRTKKRTTKPNPLGRYPANLIIDEELSDIIGDRGRILFTPKPSVKEKEEGLDALEEKILNRMNPGGLENDPKFAPVRRKNNHPTVKPIALSEYVSRMIKPPHDGARLLVPFCGSGSEMIGALKAGWSEVIGIEIDANYCEISEARIKWHLK